MSGSLFRGFPEARINPLIDLANIGRGERDALGIEQARMQMDADKAFRSVAASAAGGDPNAIRQAIAADPERGIQLQRAIAGMDDRSRQRALENAELVGQSAASLLAMPEDQAAAAYPTVLAGLKSRGLDISGLPPQYPGHERTKAFAAQFQPITQQLQSFGQQVIPVGGAGASGVPRGIRNNNPLNIEAGSFTQSMPGFQGSDGRFAKFETPEQGMAAADALLMRYGMQGRNTIQAIVSKWAPASDGNDVGGYAARVATAMGVRPDEPIPMEDATTRQRLAQAMAAVEVGPRAAQMLVQRGTGLPVTGGAQPGKAWARGPDGNPVQVPIAGAGDPVRPPEGFRGRPDGSLEPIPGGPQDPAYLEQRERTKAGARPLPPTIQKMDEGDVEDIQGASNLARDLADMKRMLADEKFSTSLLSRGLYGAANLVNASGPEGRNYATFKATVERIRNDSLRLNKGVQTEGDAVRAGNELVANINDVETVKQRLAELESLNRRAAQERLMRLNRRREQNGAPPITPDQIVSDTTIFEATKGAGQPGAGAITATNPQTGERIMLQDGKWVPVR